MSTTSPVTPPEPKPEEDEYLRDKNGNVVTDPQTGEPIKKKPSEGDKHLLPKAKEQAKALTGPSWAESTATANVNVPALISNNPNTYQNQHTAVQQFRALDQVGDTRDKVTVQGMNGPVDYIRTADGEIRPAYNSLDAIDYSLAGGSAAGPTTSGIHP